MYDADMRRSAQIIWSRQIQSAAANRHVEHMDCTLGKYIFDVAVTLAPSANKVRRRAVTATRACH